MKYVMLHPKHGWLLILLAAGALLFAATLENSGVVREPTNKSKLVSESGSCNGNVLRIQSWVPPVTVKG